MTFIKISLDRHEFIADILSTKDLKELSIQIKTSSKPFKLAAFFALGALSLLGARSFAAGAQDFTLHNDTKLEIHEVYVSANEVDNWEEDVLGEDTLSPGDAVKISFNSDEDAELWDLKVVDDKGKSYVWKKLKLMEITDVTIYFKDGKAFARSKKL